MEMTAQQARQTAENVNQSMATGQMVEIMSTINEAVNKGQFEAHYYNPVSVETASKLEELGYIIRREADRSDSFLRIMWKTALG